MRFFTCILFALAIFTLLSCAGPNSAGKYKAEGKTVYPNLVYSTIDGEDLLLDIYLPPQAKASTTGKHPGLPTILWIHGGGWRWGSKDTVPVIDLTNAGFVLVSINYRLDGHAKYPAQIDDCRAALRWLHQHAAQYNIDPNRIGVLGASAGGHLAALLGTTGGNSSRFPKVRAVCALYPPTDLITVVREDQRDTSIGLVPLLLGGSVNEKQDLAKEGSPIRYVSSDDPPFFIIHGEKDTLVSPEQSKSLHRALLKAGVSSTLKLYPEEKHGFYPDKELTQEIVQFFRKNLSR